MDAPKPIIEKDTIFNDLKEKYAEILFKYLDEREFKEDKVIVWIDNILKDAQEYFIKNFQNYDLFLFCSVCDNDLIYRTNHFSIYLNESDDYGLVELETGKLYGILYFFFYKHNEFSYDILKYESLIINKGNKILLDKLNDQKYDFEKANDLNKIINKEHSDYILTLENNAKVYLLYEIYENPVSNYIFKFISYGKDIHSKIIQTFCNEYLTCNHYVFFFK
jgi:hypothetical protein